MVRGRGVLRSTPLTANSSLWPPLRDVQRSSNMRRHETGLPLERLYPAAHKSSHPSQTVSLHVRFLDFGRKAIQFFAHPGVSVRYENKD